MNTLNIILETLTNGYKSEFFNLLSLITIFLGISVIISKNPIVSVLYLISLFSTVSIYLITLGMHFIGLSYLLVYVGAISILFLFILMLINIRVSELFTDTKNSIMLAIITGLIFSISVYYILPQHVYVFDIINVNSIFNHFNKLINNNIIVFFTESNIILSIQELQDSVGFVTSKMWDGSLAETSHIASIGNIMYTNFFMWLIVSSLILLLAMVGAIIITIKPRNSSKSKDL
jgi:NADH-ubiquinone oxidoreductase chain 6